MAWTNNLTSLNVQINREFIKLKKKLKFKNICSDEKN